MLTGNSGVITNALSAKESSEIKEEKEQLQLAVVKTMKVNDDIMSAKDEFISKLEGRNVSIIKDGDNIYVRFNDTGRSYKVSDDGDVDGPVTLNAAKDSNPGDITTDADGNKLAGTESEPYQINCIEDLCGLSNAVNKNKLGQNKYIVLTRDLDFESELSYVNGKISQEGYIESCNSIQDLMDNLTNKDGNGFLSIGGYGFAFWGFFDGKNYKIANIYQNGEKAKGLFTNVKDSIIENLTLTGEIISTSTNLTAGFIGYTASSNTNTSINNCKNYANVTGITSVGGIVGVARNKISINNCDNYGNIIIVSTEWGYGGAAGICGFFEKESITENCRNYGEISGQFYCGGIQATMSGGSIKNCKNYGNICSQETRPLMNFSGRNCWVCKVGSEYNTKLFK